jgi:hypothetical protein
MCNAVKVGVFDARPFESAEPHDSSINREGNGDRA